MKSRNCGAYTVFCNPYNTQGETFQCPRCFNLYRSRKSMLTHLRIQCQKLPRWECVHCGLKKFQKIHILKHMDTHHPNMSRLVRDNGKIK